MKKLSFVLAALFAVNVQAAKVQVNPDSYHKVGSYYGRSDGVFQDTTSKGLVAINNGEVAGQLGPAFYEDFSKYGASKGISCFNHDGTTCLGDATTVPGFTMLGDGLQVVQFPVATADLALATVATGLDIAGDLTNNDGFDIKFAGWGTNRRGFVVADDPAFYACFTVKITDVSGSDLMLFGFRKEEPMNATYTSMSDYAGIGNVSGSIYLKTGNDGSDTSTDTTDTWADLATKKVCANVSAAGAVTYTIDGVAPTTTAAFSFDAGDQVFPWVHFLHDTDVAESTIITKLEVGYTE